MHVSSIPGCGRNHKKSPPTESWFVVNQQSECPRRDDPLEPCKVCKRDGAFITHCFCKYQHDLACVVLRNKNQWKNHLKRHHLKWFDTKSTLYNNRNRAAATLIETLPRIATLTPPPTVTHAKNVTTTVRIPSVSGSSSLNTVTPGGINVIQSANINTADQYNKQPNTALLHSTASSAMNTNCMAGHSRQTYIHPPPPRMAFQIGQSSQFQHQQKERQSIDHEQLAHHSPNLVSNSIHPSYHKSQLQRSPCQSLNNNKTQQQTMVRTAQRDPSNPHPDQYNTSNPTASNAYAST
eukprot:452540_1